MLFGRGRVKYLKMNPSRQASRRKEYRQLILVRILALAVVGAGIASFVCLPLLGGIPLGILCCLAGALLALLNEVMDGVATSKD